MDIPCAVGGQKIDGLSTARGMSGDSAWGVRGQSVDLP